MDKIRLAIIGQGRSGRDIHGAFLRSENNTKFQVVAVVDAIEERRERAKKEYGCDVYADYRELFGRDDIELVVNSTFSQMHADITVDLLNHGFNVICEKPFTKTYEEGCRVVEATKKSGKMLNVFQQSRFAPHYQEIKKILAGGKLGEILEVNIVFSEFARRWDWQCAKSMNGGNIRNKGPHPLDQALDLMNFPEDVNVFAKLAKVNTFGDAEDYAKVILTAPGCPLLDVEIASNNAYIPYNYLILGQYGCLKATFSQIDYKYYDPKTAPEQKLTLEPLCKEDGTPAYCREQLNWTEESVKVDAAFPNDAVSRYYSMIYDYLRNGVPMTVVPEQVLCQLKVIDKIHAQNPMPQIH